MEELLIEGHEVMSAGIATLYIDKHHLASACKDDWCLLGPGPTYPAHKKGEKA